MKISIVLGPFHPLPPQGIGAVEKVWSELAQAFVSAGHEVTLVGKGEGDRERSEGGVCIVTLKGYRASGNLWRDLLLDMLYAMRVRSRLKPGNIVVTNSFWTPVLLGLAGERVGKIVVHVARFPKRQMSMYSRAAVLQAISSSVADEISRQTPAAKSRVRVLPYPVDLRIFRPPEAPRSYKGPPTILYVGRVHPEKGLELMVNAFRRVASEVPGSRLKIVGPSAIAQGGGGPAYIDALVVASKDLPVDFVGPIADPLDLARELQNAHCFCYPSLADRGEAFGLAVLEAMATGLPVVVSDLACFKDFVTHGREGRIFDHRAGDAPARLARELTDIISLHGLAAQMGENAAARSKDFAIDKIAARYLRLFEDVVDSTA